MKARDLLWVVAAGFLFSIMALQACGSDEAGSIPAKARLMERIRDYHQAVLEEDHATMYSMAPPYLREEVSFEAWKEGRSIDDSVEPSNPGRLVNTKIVETRFCDDMSSESRKGLYRCVIVIELTYENESGAKVELLPETWDFLGGEWYFTWLLSF